MSVPVALTAEVIEAFAGIYLSARYDELQPTPQFHRECWALYCSPHPQCLVIAPRDHAKSTALTFDYTLAEVCFRTSDYVIIIGSIEDMAAEQLSNIREELNENDLLRQDFGIDSFEQDSKTDIIVRCKDGHRFRILARGAEQKIRGKMWKGKRPNLIIGDDMEDDEQVENRDRRSKFRRWFFRAAKQALSQSGKIRVHGTILDEDSLLSRLRKNEEWKHLFYKAHTAFNDFSALLWPSRWTEAKLRARQRELIADGDAAGYSQEFLNDPLDSSEAYLRREDFLPMQDEDYDKPLVVGVGVDFAVTKKDKANRSSFTVGGKCVENLIYIKDQRVGRMDSLEIIEEFFSIQKAWHPDVFWVEKGQIWNTIEPMLYKEMQERNKRGESDCFLNIDARASTSDKAVRGRPFQKRHRARCVRFDKRTDWYAAYEAELLRFRVEAEAKLDDQFDSTAILISGFESMPEVEQEDFMEDEDLEFEAESIRLRSTKAAGRSAVTGY